MHVCMSAGTLTFFGGPRLRGLGRRPRWIGGAATDSAVAANVRPLIRQSLAIATLILMPIRVGPHADPHILITRILPTIAVLTEKKMYIATWRTLVSSSILWARTVHIGTLWRKLCVRAICGQLTLILWCLFCGTPPNDAFHQ